MGSPFGFMTQESKSTTQSTENTDNSNLASNTGDALRFQNSGDVSVLDEGAIASAFAFARDVNESSQMAINSAMENVAVVSQESNEKINQAYATSQGKTTPLDQNMLVIVSGLVLAIVAYKAVG